MGNGLNTKNDVDFPYFTGGEGVDSIAQENQSKEEENLSSSNPDWLQSPEPSRDTLSNRGANALPSFPSNSGDTPEVPIDPLLPPPIAPPDFTEPNAKEEPKDKTPDTANVPEHTKPQKAENVSNKLKNGEIDPAAFFDEISRIKGEAA